MADGGIIARVATSVGQFSADEWDALAGSDNPFVSHAFLTALEDSGSVDCPGVSGGTGWTPAPIVIEGANGRLAAALPAYLKSHSQGEYVFDHGWADAWERAGGHYYPKLQIAVPFTPATGPRMLLADKALATPLLRAAEQLCAVNELSSAHATFIAPEQVALFKAAGWMIRGDIQFHWHNHQFSTFDDFLATLSSRKRKDIRKERAAAQEGVQIKALRGAEITAAHWDAFWEFYQDTGARKWGHPYLTRAAFALFSERMADRIVLVMAFVGGQAVAGALNFVGEDTLYGRYWGATVEKPFLHFELCYYQAIDIAIELGLSRVEAGAQGSHKLARGYEPVETLSAHYITHPGFREAVRDFLERERAGVAADQAYLDTRTPFRRGG